MVLRVTWIWYFYKSEQVDQGDGINIQYYKNEVFDGPTLEIKGNSLNINWSINAPEKGFDIDAFSAV